MTTNRIMTSGWTPGIVRHWLARGAAVCAAMAFAASVEGAERRVSDPRALADAVRAAGPGDVVLMSDGVWKDVDLVVEGNASAERPITVRAQTPGKVIVSGKSRLRIGGTGVVVDGLWFKDGAPSGGHAVAFRTAVNRPATDCRLTNCAITDFNPDRKQVDTKWISIYGTRNRVDHCDLAGKTNEGTTLVVWVGAGPGEHRIDHNHFGPRPPLGVNGGETIRIGTSDRATINERSVVEANLFESCNGEGEIISNKSCENQYRGNLFLHCEGALTLRHGDRATVQGNVFLGEGRKNTGGVRVIGEDHRIVNNYFEGLTGTGARAALCVMNGIADSPASGYFQVKRASIVFNTFVDCRVPFVLGFTGGRPEKVSLPPQDCTIADNVVLRGGTPLVQVVTPPKQLSCLGNLASGLAGGFAGFTSIDPKLARGADGLFRPLDDSPMLGAAVGDFPFVVDDLDGQPRGSRRDLGCDQRSDAPVRRPVVRRAEVGPSWMRGRSAS